ncbi:unnamed protein product [Rotaria magnacalcarata]|uniref:Uncharacterized protein n=2 Tax=Rotaria magnacalcarata TaxID=392030 RepID=A0A816YUR7_9BILA|nr:unnamed protein product [Rotaria magnacalcarata]
MNSFMSTLFTLSIFYTTIVSTVYCVDLKGITVTKDEIIALTRDHFGRVDPDSLLNGFFPVWAVIQFCLAGFFLVIALVSGLCYLFGCRAPVDERSKQIK